MAKKTGIEVSVAAADAIAMTDVDVVAAYPITPQTHIVEHLADLVSTGELDAEYIPVESEHSAMSVCCGSSAAGARTFTCTSSQGLALMNEIVFLAASMNLPIVMILANRSLSGPISIWNDHSDVMSIRDSGCIQVFADNGQEVFDNVFFAFKVAENKDVSLPVIINMDGFAVSHMIEPIEYWQQEMVDKYLPAFEPRHRLDPNDPVSMGGFGMPEIFTEAKKLQDHILTESKPVILEAWKELGEVCGREYKPIEEYKMDGVKIAILTMGSMGETVSLAIDELQEKGEAVGLLKLRLWRPFPFEELAEVVKGLDQIIVIDRAVSFGGPGGPVASEIRSALYHQDEMPFVTNYVCSLAGRDITADDFIKIYEESKSASEDELKRNDYTIYGARE